MSFLTATKEWIKKEAAFTLMELLVSVAIISILAALAIPAYQEYRVRAFDSDAKTYLRNAITSLESYYAVHNVFPSASSNLLSAGLSLSPNVSFLDYKLETMSDGQPTVYMLAQHARSPNSWQASYPEDGTDIIIQGTPLKKRGKRLGQLK